MTKLTTINFHGATLVAIAGDRPETTLVAMKPVVEGMGLDWTYQSRKLQSHPVLSTCVAITAIQMQGDDQVREHTFLALNRLNFWLATIHPDRIKNENVRKAVIIYQTELADVAFNHFFGKAIASQPSAVTVADMEKQVRAAVGGIVKGVVNKALEAQSTHIRLLEAKLDQVLMLLDRPAPNPNTVVPQHKAHRQEEGDDILVVKALQQLGGKATPRAIMRRLGTAKWNALRRDIAIASLVESGHVVIEKALTKPSPGRPTMDVVRLTQVPFHQTPA